jgi:hypothetical protein
MLTGSKDVTKINKDALYDAMSTLNTVPSGLCLDLDYGQVTERLRGYYIWKSVPGEEVWISLTGLKLIRQTG